MRLKAMAIQILEEADLQPTEVEAMQLMAIGKTMPDRITKVVLTNIIYFLCHMLGWVETEGQEEIFNNAANIDFDPQNMRDTKKEIFLGDAFESM